MNLIKRLIKRQLVLATLALDVGASFFFMKGADFQLVRRGRRILVALRKSGRFNAYDDRNELIKILASIIEGINAEYFIVPKKHNKYALAVDILHKKKILKAILRDRRLRGYYVRLERSRHNLHIQQLLRRSALSKEQDIIAVEFSKYIKGASGRLITTEPNAVGIEFWYNEVTIPPFMKKRVMSASGIIDERALSGAIISPVYNQFGQIVDVASQAKGTIAIGDKDYPTLEIFKANTLHSVSFAIDLVYTWVDGGDEQWYAKFSKYKSASDPNFLNNTSSRYTSHDELKYSLRSVDMYAPWIRHIYIVTDNQRPKWLKDNEKLTVVDHTDLFNPSDLPVFNSHAIESRLHHIKGIAEHYLYLNDDMMFARSTKPDDFFFPNGIAKVSLSNATIGLGEPTVYETAPSSAGKNARKIIHDTFGSFITNKPKHAPQVQIKSVAKAIESGNSELVELVAKSKFRSPSDVPFTSVLMQNYLVASKQGVPSNNVAAVVNVSEPDAQRHLNVIMKNTEALTLCLNESITSEGSEERVHKVVKQFLEAYFPFKSQWEYTDKDDEEGQE